MRAACPAKINLFLKVLGRREDGYHEIETLFQQIDLCDELVWRPGDGSIALTVEGADLGDPERNLVVLAARAFAVETGRSAGGRWLLHKRIPAGGGLGGGSSNGAAALRMLNRFYDHPLSETAMHRLALGLGSDVPFFLCGGRRLGRGRGEVLSDDSPPRSPTRGFLLFPGLAIPTAAVFAALNAPPLTRANAAGRVGCHAVGDNDLLPAARAVSAPFDRVWRQLEAIFPAGAVWMSGSGSSLVHLTDAAELAEDVRRRLTALGLSWRRFRFCGQAGGARDSGVGGQFEPETGVRAAVPAPKWKGQGKSAGF